MLGEVFQPGMMARCREGGVVTDWCLAIHACSLTEWCLGRRVGAWGRGVLADSLNSNSQ